MYIGHKAVCPECGSEWWGWSIKQHPICDNCGAELVIIDRATNHERKSSPEKEREE